MKKIILYTFIFIGLGAVARAQTNASGTATQTTQLSLANALEITFTGNNSTTGTIVTLPFTTVTDYANGVESAAQQLKVRSNKNFNVTVKANSSTFTVTNNGTTTSSTMPASVLDLKVSDNATGGSIASPFTNYTDLTTTATNIITNGANGGNQTFSVMYKASPGFAYPAGTYNMNVVFTATQQ